MTSKLYTRTGDDGTTGLADGSRTAKESLRIETIGAVDELNALLGIIAAQQDAGDERALLEHLQHTLFSLGAELAMPGNRRLVPDRVAGLEEAIDRIDAQLPPLAHFILPGGSQSGALCHLARTVCRRAERAAFRLADREEVNPVSLKYLNRLSDLLFALARLLVMQGGGEEVIWKSS